MLVNVLIAIGLFLVLLYAVWRVRFRYPPDGTPQVLCFHKISREFCWEGTWTTPTRFAATIDALLADGRRFLTEAEYLDALDGHGDRKEHALFLTFDDAYADTLTVAANVLAARGVPWHVFVVSGFAGDENTWELSLGRRPVRHASWEQLRELVAAGVSVGSHSRTHADLTRLSGDTLREELSVSRSEIETQLGVTVRTVSYPFGRYNASVCAAAQGAGYEAAFSLYPRHANERVERYALRRNGVYIIDPVWAVKARLSRHRLFWFEEMKCRAINAVAALTPLLTRPRPPAPGS